MRTFFFKVRIQCVQTLGRIFGHPSALVSTPYIHSLAPRILEYLSESKPPTSDQELELFTESVGVIELLIPKTTAEHSKLEDFSLYAGKNIFPSGRRLSQSFGRERLHFIARRRPNECTRTLRRAIDSRPTPGPPFTSVSILAPGFVWPKSENFFFYSSRILPAKWR